jgi:hypothetical protein
MNRVFTFSISSWQFSSVMEKAHQSAKLVVWKKLEFLICKDDPFYYESAQTYLKGDNEYYEKDLPFTVHTGKMNYKENIVKVDPIKRGAGNALCCTTAKLVKPLLDLKELCLLELFPNQ